MTHRCDICGNRGAQRVGRVWLCQPCADMVGGAELVEIDARYGDWLLMICTVIALVAVIVSELQNRGVL